MVDDTSGHRRRLRTKFLNSGFSGFLDYEIIELLLTIGLPRKDCKPLAKELIAKFKTATGVINANDSELTKVKGLGSSSIIGIRLAREIGIYSSRESLATTKNDNFDIEKLAKLLIQEIGHNKKETFKIACLDTKGSITSDTVFVGSLNESVVHPREVFIVAIENNAASIVIAHNHPSGNTEPSEDDIYITRKIVESGKIVGIQVTDHLIVSSNGYTSLAKLGYL